MAGSVHEFTDGNFSETLSHSEAPVLVDFWAVWCGPCRAIAPAVEALSEEMGDKLTVGKLNIDDSPKTAAKFGVRSIPTLILFKDGQPIDQIVGAVPKAKIEAMVLRHI